MLLTATTRCCLSTFPAPAMLLAMLTHQHSHDLPPALLLMQEAGDKVAGTVCPGNVCSGSDSIRVEFSTLLKRTVGSSTDSLLGASRGALHKGGSLHQSLECVCRSTHTPFRVRQERSCCTSGPSGWPRHKAGAAARQAMLMTPSLQGQPPARI